PGHRHPLAYRNVPPGHPLRRRRHGKGPRAGPADRRTGGYVTEFDAATAAVEAALAAGARYADARVMHRRYESMSARNGEIEELAQDEDAGLGVRALVGSGWGFFAVPDLGDAAVRQAGERAAAIAAASATVSGPAADLVPATPATASWASECKVDPLAVPLSEKGDLLVGATAEAHRAGADQAEGLYQIWDTR